MKGVFSYKPNSPYNDIKGQLYHFPKTYLSRVRKILNNHFIYYEKLPDRKGRFYSGLGRVAGIRPDENLDDHYYADLTDYIDFDRLVPYREQGGFERKLAQSDGKVNGGTAQSAVRVITEEEFAKIVGAGLSEEPEWPDRLDDADIMDVDETPTGFYDFDSGQPEIIDAPANRPIVEQLVTRKWRDKKFKQHIRIAYDRTCAFTSLRLINGRGRPEVEAAHIRPVEKGGNDWVRNGIALSGTVHWMFDRGLLSIDNDFNILRSRHLNSDVGHLLNKDSKAKVPSDTHLQPHPEYMEWHRKNVFKD